MNQVFTHPSQPQMQVEVILASAAPTDAPNIYTIRMRYPRIIHGEIMTHRVFSRNARSSRAVPVKTMLFETITIPFVPWHWGKNQKGMQGGEECNEPVEMGDPFIYADSDAFVCREEAWLRARDAAVSIASGMMDAGYHKQIPNRLLEPFSWIDTLITSTEWDNFLWLRDHKDAEPHLQDLARLVHKALDSANVRQLGEHGGWHLPYIEKADYNWAYEVVDAQTPPGTVHRQERAMLLAKISAARCARISYKPFDGDASYERELARYDMLVSADRVHASPTEHQATPDTWAQEEADWSAPGLHGNLEGWIQARKLIPNERWIEGMS